MTLNYILNTNDEGNLIIYDITGKFIKNYSLNVSQSLLNIDVSVLMAGAYFYEVKINGNKIKSDKLIIIK